MTDPHNTEDGESAPFVVFNNNLEMMARIIDSSCQLSLNLLAASRLSQQKMGEAIGDAMGDATDFTAIAKDMIPSTGDVDHAAAAVTIAMNDAAARALAMMTGDTHGDPEIPVDPPVASAKTKRASRRPANGNAKA